jgi:hypothetical protein
MSSDVVTDGDIRPKNADADTHHERDNRYQNHPDHFRSFGLVSGLMLLLSSGLSVLDSLYR